MKRTKKAVDDFLRHAINRRDFWRTQETPEAKLKAVNWSRKVAGYEGCLRCCFLNQQCKDDCEFI